MKTLSAWCGLLLGLIGQVQAMDQTALDEYVQRPDPAYGWSLYHKDSALFARHFFIKLTSQNWLDESRVDRPRWEHEIKISQPRALFCGLTANRSDTAIIVISGGKNNKEGKMSTEAPPFAGMVAKSFCRMVVELRQVPNQPLTFSDENDFRKEDSLIAYSFDRYLKGTPGDWPVQLAMVKSVVQAMNAIQEFSRTRKDIPDINNFVLLGASKRGWTAWLTAAVDPRVKAIVPVSIDMLDLAQQFPHHFASYGTFSNALRDYQAFNLGARMATNPRGEDLLEIVDPIHYRERLQQPKLLLHSAGDEFFVSDSSRFYYDKLLGDKRMRYTVNSDHRQGGSSKRYELILAARNWINDVLEGETPPSLKWWQEADGTLVVQPSKPAHEVKLWTADNPKARDFRLETLGAGWTAVELKADSDGRYRVRLQKPEAGWRASLVEAAFGCSSNSRQIYTTGVYVTPDTLPYQPGQPSKPELRAAGDGATPTLGRN